MGKIKKHVFRIALLERFTNIGERGYKPQCELMEVDGVGIYVYHSMKDKSEITDGLVRRHLIGGRSTFALVEADTETEAKTLFLAEWEGAKCGTRSPALRIAEGAQITKYPLCEKLHRNNRGEYVCGRPYEELSQRLRDEEGVTPGNGEWGMCMIAGYDSPLFDDCPIQKEREEHIADKWKK